MEKTSSAAKPVEPRTAASVLDAIESGRIDSTAAPVATGFTPLDRVLNGGLRAGELICVGGAPGVGKTIVTLQWARATARAGGTAIYACYEHDEEALMARLIALEAGEQPASDQDVWVDLDDEGRLIGSSEAMQRAAERVRTYADRLWLVRASGSGTGLDQLAELIEKCKGPRRVLFVDYLQKVAYRNGGDELERVTRIAEGLKDLALQTAVPIVSVVAGGSEGLAARRLRLYHLTASPAIAYESDVILLLNDKAHCVSKAHLAYDAVRAKTFHDYVVFSVEKNRRGPTAIDLEFRKDFGHFRFDPIGSLVAERLVDERVFTE
jgi:replicative DNA helicase